MKRYLIERNIPGVGHLNDQQLKQASSTSNAALAKLAGRRTASFSVVTSWAPRAVASASRRARSRGSKGSWSAKLRVACASPRNAS